MFGAKIFWSHDDHPTYAKWLVEVGFKTVPHKPVKKGNSGRAIHDFFVFFKK